MAKAPAITTEGTGARKAETRPKMGRPSVMTPETETLLCDALLREKTRKKACQVAGVSEDTLSRHLKRSERFATMVKTAEKERGEERYRRYCEQEVIRKRESHLRRSRIAREVWARRKAAGWVWTPPVRRPWSRHYW